MYVLNNDLFENHSFDLQKKFNFVKLPNLAIYMVKLCSIVVLQKCLVINIL